jgi:hypothetical protein
MCTVTISTALAAAFVLAARIVVADPRGGTISGSNLPGRQGAAVPTGSSGSPTGPGSEDFGPGTRDTNGSGAYGAGVPGTLRPGTLGGRWPGSATTPGGAGGGTR